MTVREYYAAALEENHESLILLIEFLMFEKKVLKASDSVDKLTYYLQDKFKNKMNDYLQEYERGKQLD